MLSEARVRRVIGVEGAEVLIEITKGAWQDYEDENVPRQHRTTRANIVWDYMIKRSDDVLAGMEGVRRVERQKRPMYVLRESLLLRPKKHTDAAPHNYLTEPQTTVQTLGQLPEFREFAVVSFGYQLDPAEAGVQDFLVTSAPGPWVINLEDLAAGELRPATQIFPHLERDLDEIEPIRRRAV